MTSHPDPAYPTISSSVAHNEQWIAFNSIQTFSATHLIADVVAHDHNLEPAKPVVMAEGAYEGGVEYGFDVSPLWVRRQAYWTYCAGGHHSYGHNDAWRMPPTWKEALDAPGAGQMLVLKRIFTALTWWTLVPDQTIITAGANEGNNLNIAARSETGDWLMAYLCSQGSVKIRLDVLSRKKCSARWIDPRDGSVMEIGSVTNSGEKSFTVPAGWEDAVLIIEG
jgi:hypothetical protein